MSQDIKKKICGGGGGGGGGGKKIGGGDDEKLRVRARHKAIEKGSPSIKTTFKKI